MALQLASCWRMPRDTYHASVNSYGHDLRFNNVDDVDLLSVCDAVVDSTHKRQTQIAWFTAASF